MYPWSFLYRILPILVLSVLAGGLYWFVLLNTVDDEQKVVLPPRHIPDYFMQNFSGSALNKEGVAHYRMQGKILVHYEDDQTYEMTYPMLRVFQSDQPDVTVIAQLGTMDGTGEEIKLMGDAKLIRAATMMPRPSSEVEARSAFFRILPNQDIIDTDKSVELHNDTSILIADGMRYHNVERVITFSGNVRGQLDASKNNKAQRR